LHVGPDLCGRLGSGRSSDLVQVLDTLHARILGDLIVGLARLKVLANVVGARTAKDDEIEKGVGSKTVGTMNRDTGSFTSRVQALDDLVLALAVLGDDLAVVVGRNAAHVVVYGGEDGDGLLRDVDTGEDRSGL